MAQRTALIIANDRYEQENLPDLASPAADAEALRAVLADPQVGDFAVQVVHNEPSYEISARIEELLADSRADDLLLLHFSGHGVKAESGELFFAAPNTRRDRLGSTAVSAEFVQRCLRTSRSRRIVLLLDCCYSGAFSRGVTVRAAEVNPLDSFPEDRIGGGRGRAVISASSETEYAFEPERPGDDRRSQPSLFTAALVEGLLTGEADRDEDGWVSLDELYDYVFDKVHAQNPNQTPRRQFDLQGELYLARSRRRRIRAAPLPPDLQTALTDPNMYTRLGAIGELRSRLASDNLPAAVGAHEALAELARTDIQYVAGLASATLREAAVQPSELQLRFGPAERGAAPLQRTIRLLGPPVARACVASPSADWIRVDQASDILEITIDTAETGTRHGRIDLKGPTGAAVIEIDVELVEPPPVEIVEPSPAEIVEPVPPDPPAGAPPEAAPAAASPGPADGAKFDLSDLFSSTPHARGSQAAPPASDSRIGDLLGGLFSKPGKGQSARNGPARRGADVETEAALSFSEAMDGATLSLRLAGEGPCPTCQGIGAKAGTMPTMCPTCDGSGQQKSRRPGWVASEPCQKCRGRGLVVDDPCPACSGNGRATSSRTIQARMPPGVGDGQRVKLAGKGAPGERGGPPGDLYVRVYVQPHPVFGRTGSNLTVTIPLTFPELVLGGEVTVPVLGQPPITIRIPPGTPAGRTFRVRGRGFAQAGGDRGDLLVTVGVLIPASVTDGTRRLVEQLQAAMDPPQSQRAEFLAEAAGGRPAPRRLASSVGFDFGTTYSAVAILDDDGRPKVIADADGSQRTPSVVTFPKNGGVLVGEPAMRPAATNANQTIRSVKRRLGTDWSVQIDDKTYTAQQISAFILQKLKRDAEAYLGEKITDAVITVPAYFNYSQRLAVKEAGQIAGLNVLRIINEPTAVALAEHLEDDDDQAMVLIFDLGGGTFDVSLLLAGDGVLKVKASSGDSRLGGDDWDQRIVDRLVKDFKNSHGIDLSQDKMALRRLYRAAEDSKIELSQATRSQINLPYISHSDQGPLHLDTRLTRAEFEKMTADLLDRCQAPFQQVIKDAGVSVTDIEHVVLVGGSTYMPAVVNLVKNLTGQQPTRGASPEEAVVAGACLQAGMLNGEIVAVTLDEITPLSLGIEAKGGVLAKLIERNTTIPARHSEIFTTADDNQRSVQIQVFQGDREIAAYNKKLGMFELAGLAPAPRGVPQIEVTFDVDANGIVSVSAKDLGSGREESVTISGGSGLSSAEITRMAAETAKLAPGASKDAARPARPRRRRAGGSA
jgi:molecular chaperone DnaK